MPVTINLSWPANPESEFVNKYEVHQSVDGGAFSLIANVTSPAHQVLNPLPGAYRWKVRAVNFVGTGNFGNIADGPSDVPTPPGDITIDIVVS